MKIAVLSPILGSVDIEHMSAIENLPPTITRVRYGGCNMLDQARSALVSAAQSTAADIYVWIDSDIIFAPGDVTALANKVSNMTPIVSGLYLTKDEENNIIGFINQDDPIAAPEMWPASRVGFGFLAMQANVFNDIGKDLPNVILASAGGIVGKPYFMPLIHEGQYLAEDFSFCVRAEKAGIKMFLSHDIRVKHKGTKSYVVSETSHYRSL